MFVRTKECMVNPEFAAGIQSANGHIYEMALREKVMDELKLTEDIKLEEIDWKNVPMTEKEIRALKFDETFSPIEKYSLNRLNNEEAIGFNNLEERAANVENNRDIAHSSPLDKLLADYFLK